MTIDKSGKWWVGDRPEDLVEYLTAYASEEYAVDEVRLAKCTCGGVVFTLSVDADEGAAQRVCASCGEEHLVCDSAECWDDANPQQWACGSCACVTYNVGVGFSIYDDQSAIRWLYAGCRCTLCGALGCFADWKIAYAPSMHLMDQV